MKLSKMCFHFDDKILITYLLLHSSINLLESFAQNEFMEYYPQQVEGQSVSLERKIAIQEK